jgi:hypothetical protein
MIGGGFITVVDRYGTDGWISATAWLRPFHFAGAPLPISSVTASPSSLPTRVIGGGRAEEAFRRRLQGIY